MGEIVAQTPEVFEVESSTIVKFEYVPSMLRATFKRRDGGTEAYEYADVPRDVLLALLNADSVGSEFHKLIKQGGYSFTKVDDAG